MDEAQGTKAALSRDYDADAEGYEAHWEPVLAVMAQDFVSQLDLASSEAVVDIGAGTGSLLRYLPEQTCALVVGADRSFGMLRTAPAEALRVVMDGEDLAFKDESFDTALAMFVLFHLPDPHAALQEISRILRKGGILAFTTWGDDDPDFRAFEVFDAVLDKYGAAEGRRLYARYELSDTTGRCRTLLEEGGFDVVSVRAARMAHRWTIDHLVGFRTKMGYGRVRWQSLDTAAQARAMKEGLEALAELSEDEMVLRDEVIYSIGRLKE